MRKQSDARYTYDIRGTRENMLMLRDFLDRNGFVPTVVSEIAAAAENAGTSARIRVYVTRDEARAVYAAWKGYCDADISIGLR